MLSRGNTLHFINRVDSSNCGDLLCCPLVHYYEYFRKYTLLRHDIRYIEFDFIAPTDVVILGGGGLLDYSECCNRAINKLLNIGASVIAWSPGFNTHSEYDGTFSTKIEFEKFKLLTVRDYENKYDLKFLPDVTCKLTGLGQKYTIRRKYGIARHKDYPINGLDMYDEITNNSSIDNILRFLGETEIVISNSYHLIYWSILMGKKTICVSPFSSRFYGYKYKPVYCDLDTKKIPECVEKAENYDVLEECIKENDKFFEQVKKIIECKLSPVPESTLSLEYITDTAIWKGYARDKDIRSGDVLISQLFIDTGEGFTEEKKKIAINNVIGDEISCVRFDISNYSHIKRLRFDPIEDHMCEVEIISATTDKGEVRLIPKVNVYHGFKHCFFTTDPQYFIDCVSGSFLEIKFKLKVLNKFDTEQTAKEYFEYSENLHNEQISIIDNQNAKLSKQNSVIDSQNAKLSIQGEIINSQNAKLSEQGSVIDSQNTKLSEQGSVIDSQNAIIEKQASEIEKKDYRINEQNLIIENQSDRINEQISTITNQSQQLSKESIHIESLNEMIRSMKEQIEHQKAEIESLYHSKSWKITTPLRGIFSFIRKLLKGKPQV